MNKVAFITMDVESYYDTTCLKKNNIPSDDKYDCAEEIKKFLDFLNMRNIKATFFVTVDFLPRCKDFLLEAIKSGHEIALHCLHHVKVKKLSSEEFDTSVKEAKRIIKDELGIDMVGNRFPEFVSKKKHQSVIEEDGFKYDSVRFAPSKKEYTKLNDLVYQNGKFYDFVLARTPLFKLNISGGGFVRLIPWKIIGPKIKRHIKKKDSYILYIHPFEIHEGDLPNYNVNFLKKLYLKRGRDIYLYKIDQIINWMNEEKYQFLTMSEYIEKYGREN